MQGDATLEPVDGFPGEVGSAAEPVPAEPIFAEPIPAEWHPSLRRPGCRSTRPRLTRCSASLGRTTRGVTQRSMTASCARCIDLLKMGPTSANCSPARFLFLRTSWSKERLRPALSAGNRRALAAPVIAIVAHDPRFYNMTVASLPARADAKPWFEGNPEFAAETAFRNGTLQGAYLLMAARAVGLDAGSDVGLRQ